MQRRRIRERSPDQTRQRLRHSARLLFGAHGYDAVGIREIAAHAGVNSQLIKHHFGSKRDLLNDLLIRDFAFAAGRLGSATMGGSVAAAPVERLERWIEALGEVARRRPWFPAIVASELLTGGANLGRGVRGRLSEMCDGLGALVDAVTAGGGAEGTAAPDPAIRHATVLTMVGLLTSMAIAVRSAGEDTGQPLSHKERRRQGRRTRLSGGSGVRGGTRAVGPLPDIDAYTARLRGFVGHAIRPGGRAGPPASGDRAAAGLTPSGQADV